MAFKTSEAPYPSPDKIEEISRVFPKVPKVSRKAHLKIKVTTF